MTADLRVAAVWGQQQTVLFELEGGATYNLTIDLDVYLIGARSEPTRAQIVHVVADSELAVLITADAARMPHATWVNVLADSLMEELITITAPTTQKIANLQVNPQAEWMFASPAIETIVYLSGPTQILVGDQARECWNRMPGKSRAYYKNYCDTDNHLKFAVIRTQVTKVVYCRPMGYRKTVVMDEIAAIAA